MSQEVFLCQFLLTAHREKKHCNKYSVTSSLHVIWVIVLLASHLESRCVTNIQSPPYVTCQPRKRKQNIEIPCDKAVNV